MSYLDDRMKVLLKKQALVNKQAYKVSVLRQKAHGDIERTIGRAILKGSYLSQEIWALPANWIDSTQRYHLVLSATISRANMKRWNSILANMKEYCYRVELEKNIFLVYRESELELQADDNEKLSAFIKKHGMHVVCPDVDAVVTALEGKLEFVKRIREQLKAA